MDLSLSVNEDLTAEKAALYRQVGIFELLDEEEFAVLAASSELETFPKFSTIFKKGEKAGAFYIIASGEVTITAQDEEYGNPGSLQLARYIGGEVFGEQDFFERTPRSANAIASENSLILTFPGPEADLTVIQLQHPRVFAKIYHKLISSNAGRMRQIHKLITEKTGWVAELKRKMFFDKLTGVRNRMYLEDELAFNFDHLGKEFCLLVVKPDNFKTINDTFGHEAGDTALRAIASKIESVACNGTHAGSSPENEVIRYRGNEFVVALKELNLERAAGFARHLLEELNAYDIGASMIKQKSLFQTFSIGVAAYPLHEKNLPLLVEIAFAKVFQQRELGGNGVLVAEDTQNNLNQFLQSLEIFQKLALSELDQLSRHLRPLTVETGEAICRQNESGEELFLIQSGHMSVQISMNDGESKEIALLGPGEFFGEMAIFENAPRSATCTAKEKSQVYSLQKDAFFRLMDKYPNTAISIMRNILDKTSTRVNQGGKVISQLVKWGDEASLRAVTDKLTGVFNRRYLASQLDKHFNRSQEQNGSLVLVMADMDYFREVNESYSHEIGDQYIVEVANVFKNGFRKEDVVARYGGDEFTILLPDTDLKTARAIVEKIRRDVRALTFLDQYEGPDLNLSVSLGVAGYPESCSTLPKLRELADKALYHAKDRGRNRTVTLARKGN